MNAITYGTPFSAYQATPGINASLLAVVRKSTLHARDYLANPKPSTSAMSAGTLSHAVMLEPNRAIIAVAGDRRTNAGKAEYADALERAGADGIVCSAADRDRALAMFDAVMRNRTARMIVEQTQHEVSMFWTGAYGQAKGRADMLSSSKLADYKTTAQIEHRAFMRTSENLWYHGKIGWYAEGLKAITGDIPEAWIIAQEASSPYDVAVYRIPAHIIEQGRKEAVELAMRWRVAEATGIYQGVAPDVLEYERPAFAAGGDEQDVSTGSMSAEDL